MEIELFADARAPDWRRRCSARQRRPGSRFRWQLRRSSRSSRRSRVPAWLSPRARTDRELGGRRSWAARGVRGDEREDPGRHVGVRGRGEEGEGCASQAVSEPRGACPSVTAPFPPTEFPPDWWLSAATLGAGGGGPRRKTFGCCRLLHATVSRCFA